MGKTTSEKGRGKEPPLAIKGGSKGRLLLELQHFYSGDEGATYRPPRTQTGKIVTKKEERAKLGDGLQDNQRVGR